MQYRLTQLRAPFWSRIPFFGLQSYPDTFERRGIFWASSIVYAFVYFFIIAFLVVTAVHALWAWTSIHDYFIATLFEVVYKNPLLVIGFVALEVYAIFKQATSAVPPVKRSLRLIRLCATPAVYVVVFYAALKLMTGNDVLEPNVVPVLLGSYLIAVGGAYLASRY